MSLSQSFDQFKDKCPWKRKSPGDWCNSVNNDNFVACALNNCAILYWLERAFIDNNPGDVDLSKLKD